MVEEPKTSFEIEYHKVEARAINAYLIHIRGLPRFYFYYVGYNPWAEDSLGVWHKTNNDQSSWEGYVQYACGRENVRQVSRLEVLVVCGDVPTEEEIIKELTE